MPWASKLHISSPETHSHAYAWGVNSEFPWRRDDLQGGQAASMVLVAIALLHDSRHIL